MPGDHHHGRLDAHRVELVKDFHPVHVGHLDVAEDDVVLLLLDHLYGYGAVLGHVHVVSFVPEDLLKGVADRPFVIYYKNLHKQCFRLLQQISDIFLSISKKNG